MMLSIFLKIMKHRTAILILLFTASLNRADVVTQWSFEDNLNDTAPSGIQNDDLKAFGEPEYFPGVPGLSGKAVKGLSADTAHRLRAKDSWDLDLEESWTLEVLYGQMKIIRGNGIVCG